MKHIENFIFNKKNNIIEKSNNNKKNVNVKENKSDLIAQNYNLKNIETQNITDLVLDNEKNEYNLDKKDEDKNKILTQENNELKDKRKEFNRGFKFIK